MYKRVKIKKLGRKRSHRVSLIQNQIRTLFNNGVLKTTTPKAKAVKSVAQSVLADIEKDKDMSLDTRRKLQKIFGSKELVQKAIKYVKEEEHGVRIRKVGFRAGDNAQMSRVELIGFEGKRKRKLEKKEEPKKEKKETKETKTVNKNIDKKDVQKSASGKASKATRKSTQRVRTRAGL
jgi:large subunit ribosomal protein L17